MDSAVVESVVVDCGVGSVVEDCDVVCGVVSGSVDWVAGEFLAGVSAAFSVLADWGVVVGGIEGGAVNCVRVSGDEMPERALFAFKLMVILGGVLGLGGPLAISSFVSFVGSARTFVSSFVVFGGSASFIISSFVAFVGSASVIVASCADVSVFGSVAAPFASRGSVGSVDLVGLLGSVGSISCSVGFVGSVTGSVGFAGSESVSVCFVGSVGSVGFVGSVTDFGVGSMGSEGSVVVVGAMTGDVVVEGLVIGSVEVGVLGAEVDGVGVGVITGDTVGGVLGIEEPEESGFVVDGSGVGADGVVVGFVECSRRTCCWMCCCKNIWCCSTFM